MLGGEVGREAGEPVKYNGGAFASVSTVGTGMGKGRKRDSSGERDPRRQKAAIMPGRHGRQSGREEEEASAQKLSANGFVKAS